MFSSVIMGDSEFLTGLSIGELEALAESQSAPNQQARLDELLEKQQEGVLPDEEVEELDQLLVYIDELTILKTRAEYTLWKMPPT
jgi:hypothetical protein